MKSTMQYSVGGNIIDVADDRRDEFLADYQKDYGEGEAPEEVYTFWVNGEPVQVKASRVAEFLADCEADGVEARRTRNFVMDDGQQLRLDDTAAANFVNARRSGMPMSRGLLKQTGIPEQYGRSAAEREALADLFAKLYPEDKGVNYDDLKYDVPRNLGDTVMDAARPIVENPAVQGFAEGLKRSVTDPAELYRETYGDGVITSALLGAQDFANTAVKGGMDVVAKAAGGQDTEVGRAIREAESKLPTDQADMGTDGSVTDTVLNFANDFSKNTLSTLMKYAAPGVAAVDIAGSVVDNYYDAYNKAIENGANADKANALASASAGIGAAEGIWLAQSASGGVAQNAVKGALKRIFSMGGKMGTAAGARDIVEQGIEGAENPDLVRAGKEALKGAAEGAAFEATSMGVHGLAGMDGSKRSTKRSVDAFREDKAKQEERAYAKKNYDSRLSDEANADIDATVGEMIKNEVVPSWRQAEEVRQKAIEKLATREKGESHEAVEQAVMEAAQEVRARLQEPTRVETPALERRQTEAKMRDNERGAKARDEYYAEEESARRAEADRKGAEVNADLDAQRASYEKRERDIRAAFERGDNELVAKLLAEQKAEMDAYNKAEAERKAREYEEENTLQPHEVRIEVDKPVEGESMEMRDTPEYKSWLKKKGRVDSDKNWNRYVAENELDPALRVDRGRNGDPEETWRRGEIREEVEGAIGDIRNRIIDRNAKDAERKAREADIEAAFREFTEEPVAKPDGKGKMVKEKPKSAISEDKQKAVREDATMQDIMARAKNAKTDAEKSALQDEFNNRWHQLFDKPADTEAPKMDYAEAVKTLGGMDAALPERELRKKMAQWEEHADDPRAAKMAEAARAVLERRASQGKPKQTDEVVTNGEKTAKVDKETPESVQEVPIAEKKSLKPDGKGRMKPVAEEAPKPVEKEAPTPKKTLDVAAEPTDEGFKAWAVDSDGKPMAFASETDREQSRKTFDDLVRRGRVDGKTGANIDAEVQAPAPDTKPKDTANDDAAFNSWRMKNGRKDSKAAREAYAKDFDGAIRSAANGETAHLDAVIDNFANSHLGKLPVKVKNTYDNLRKKNPQIVNREVTFGAVEQYVKKTLGLKGKKAEKIADTLYSRFNAALQQHQQNVDAHDAEMRDIRRRAAKNAARTRSKNPYQEFGISYGIPNSIASKGELEVARWVVSDASNGKYKGPKDFYDYCKELVDRADAMPDEYVAAQAEAKTRADKAQLDETRGSVVDADGRKWKIAERTSEYDRIVDETTGEEYIIPKDDLTVLEKYNENTTRKVQTGEGASVHNEADGRGEGGTRGVRTEAIGKAEKRVDKLDSPKHGTVEARTIDESADALDRIIAEEEAGSANGGAMGLPSRSHQWPEGKGVKPGKEISRNSIIRKAKELFPEFAIRGENTTKLGKSSAGHWEPWRELIRSKDTASIDTIPHEIGHGIDSLTRKSGLAIPQEAKRELVKYGHQLYPDKNPNGGYMGEGMAEYVRGYIVGQQDKMAKEVPALHKWFTESFARKHPEYVRRLDKLAEEVTYYRQQNAIQEMRAMQEPETTVMQRVKNTVKRIFSQEVWNDEGATLDKGMKASGLDELYRWQDEAREIEKAIKDGDTAKARRLAESASRKIESDPRIMAAHFRGTAKARVVDMLENGVSNLIGNKRIGNLVLDADGLPKKDANGNYVRDGETESYQDIFKGFSRKEMKDWDIYSAAKIGLENYVKEGREFGMGEDKLKSIVDKLETPKFKDALSRFTRFQDRVMSLVLEAGAISPESYKAITSHKYYVRTERRFEDDGVDVGGGKQGSPLNKIKGSSRNILNPRAASVQQLYRVVEYAQRMKVINMVARTVEDGEAINSAHENRKNDYSGRTFHIAANMPIGVNNAKEAVKFSSEKIKSDFVKRASRAFEEKGLSDADKMAFNLYKSMYGDEGDTLQIFREAPSKGKNGLVSTYVDGKLKTVEIPDGEWAKYFTETGNPYSPKTKVGKVAWFAATAPAKTLRLGATGLKAMFQTANIGRDTKNAAVVSESGFVPYASSAKGLVDELRNADNAKMFRSMGGKMANLSGANAEGQWRRGANAALARNVIERIIADTDRRHPVRSTIGVLNELVNTAEDALGVMESASRNREFGAVMKKAKGMGLSDDAAALLSYAAGKDIALDFGKGGRLMKKINEIVPFTNAVYRGIEQMSRKMGITDALPTEFNGGKGFVRSASDKDAQGMKDAARRGGKTVGRALMWITIPEVVLSTAKMLMSDDDEKYAEFNKNVEEKWGYDDVLGVRIPQSYDFGAIFGSIPKGIVYEAFGDKGAATEATLYALDKMFSSLRPDELVRNIALISPWIDILQNEKWDNSPLVSPVTMERFPNNKEEWVDYATTDIAKKIGEKFGWAPIYIDHVVNSYTGGAWNRWMSPAADNSLMTLTGLSTFRQRPTARRDVNEFYGEREKLKSAYNAGKATPEQAGKLKRADELAKALQPDFKEARELNASGLNADERRKKREEIMERVYKKIRKYNESTENYTTVGLAKAANALIDMDEGSDGKAYKGVLKGVPMPTIEAAIRAYGNEIITTPVRNSQGKKTGRVKKHRRWTNETINDRIRELKRIKLD